MSCNVHLCSVPISTVAHSRGWHPEQIKAAVRMHGSTLAELSRRHGYHQEAARIALRRRWPRLEQIIADFLGISPAELWPDRYPESRRRRPVKRKAAPRG
jgi:Ner family transcriptional regulator